MTSKFSDFSDLIRLPLGIMASISGLAAGFTVIRLQFPSLTIFDIIFQYLGQILVGLPIPFLIVTASMAINDYYDYPADVENNRQDRPLVRNAFTKSFALYTAILMFLTGLFLSFLLFIFWEHVEFYIFVLTAGFILLALSYSTWMKSYGFLGNIGVSLSYPAALVLGGLVVGISKEETLITIVSFGGLIFVSALGREVLKGVMDIEGDRLLNVRTIAVRYGPKNAARLSTFLFLLALPLAPIPLFFGFSASLVSSIIYASFITVLLALQIYSGLILIRQPTKEVGIKGRKITKLAFWAGVIGLFLAAITL